MDQFFCDCLVWIISATELDRLDVYLMALSAVSRGYKLNVIGPARKDFYDTIGSMDKLWAYKEFG